MMTLLIPLGLLGLLSIAAWLIIYLIKPNYQQKVISSTFVWKLSLKYRKKRLPVSKLRNIILIICQVLILVACALILARPSIVSTSKVSKNEVIAIIDSSVSMRTEIDEETRYERAVEGVKELAENVFAENGTVSVILAGADSSFLVERVAVANKAMVMAELDELISDLDDLACSYGSADIDSALMLSEDVLAENPTAKIYIFTDIEYSYIPEGISVVNVSSDEEWNAAILNAYTQLEDGYYSIVVDVAYYGISSTIDLHVDVNGANAIDNNDDGSFLSFDQPVTCIDNETITVIFRNGVLEDYEKESENIVFVDLLDVDKFYSYKSIHIYVDEYDSFRLDNSFDIYGGQKEVLKVQYASNLPNRFMTGVLSTMKLNYEARWDIQITEVNTNRDKPAIEKFDLYIFEHYMPNEMPTDGVVFLMDLGSAPQGSNLSYAGDYDMSKISVPLTQEMDHPLMKNIVADDITVSRFNAISTTDASYEVLMACEDRPVALIKDDGMSKVLVLGFSVHYSNIAITKYFPLFFLNVFDYFYPATVSSNAFEVNESIILNSMSEQLFCSTRSTPFTEFPAQMSFTVPGTYTFSQTTFFGKYIEEYVFVKIPAEESDIRKVSDGLTSPYKNDKEVLIIDDLLLYFAIALVALLFIEWLLQAKENF